MPRLGLVVAIALAAGSVAHAAEPTSFAYLYVRAHEGNASGGHAAIRFGPSVFDFQNQDGLVVPRREDARRFQHLYRTLENRSIERSQIAASPETAALLGDTFERRLLAQTRQIEIAGELGEDLRLLEALAIGAPVEVPVRGAGFFAAAAAGAPVLRELHDQIAASKGPQWLVGRAAAAERTLRRVSLAPPALDAIAIDPLAYPTLDAALSRRLAYALAARRALELLAAPHALRPELLAPDAGLVLDGATRDRLLALRAALLEATARLAESRRPDWGEAFLLGAARLAALDASLAADRLVVLDALPASARRLPMTARRRNLVPALLAEARGDLDRARDRLFGAARRESSYSAFEAAVGRVAALRAAEAGAPELRVAAGVLLPEGLASVALDPLPEAPRAEIERALAATRSARAALRGRLVERYGYDLLRRNCVTEIFRTVEIALTTGPRRSDAAEVERTARAEAERRLGGYVDPAAGVNFVPFVSSRSVREQWNVTDHAHLPSVREHAVRDGSLASALRESNALTATFYEPGDRAGFFVFFTDSPWPLRPLLGALNLAAALVRSGVGVATLPFDRGAGLRHGLDGALWSVPELVFANVRKGTSDWVPPELRPPAE